LRENDKPPETGGDVRWGLRAGGWDVKHLDESEIAKNALFSEKCVKRYLDTA